MSTLKRAIAIAVEAHAGQKDKANEPYIRHALRVMMMMDDEPSRIVAVLHDVIEDSDDEWTLDRLRGEGFSSEIFDAIGAVTKRAGESYTDFVRRAWADPIARKVKRADLEDNCDPSRIRNPTRDDLERIARYHRAIALMLELDASA